MTHTRLSEKTTGAALERMLGNRLGNAINDLDTSRSGEVMVPAQHQSDVTTFQMCDNGQEIAEAHIPKVFE